SSSSSWSMATTLTLSERWLTTQTSRSLRAATATGSTPTGMEPVWTSRWSLTRKTSRRSSGVVADKRCRLSGDRASGRTCPLSNSVYEDGVAILAPVGDASAEAAFLDGTAARAAVSAKATRARSHLIEPRYESCIAIQILLSDCL